MSSLIVTLIFLFPTGEPAKGAWVFCTGLAMFEAGNDVESTAPAGSRLLLDKRGATVLIAPRPTTISCSAREAEYAWRGDLKLDKSGEVKRLTLKADS